MNAELKSEIESKIVTLTPLAEKLWLDVQTSEAHMKPMNDAHKKVVSEWSKTFRELEALKMLVREEV
jgi:hypothetical protein